MRIIPSPIKMRSALLESPNLIHSDSITPSAASTRARASICRHASSIRHKLSACAFVISYSLTIALKCLMLCVIRTMPCSRHAAATIGSGESSNITSRRRTTEWPESLRKSPTLLSTSLSVKKGMQTFSLLKQPRLTSCARLLCRRFLDLGTYLKYHRLDNQHGHNLKSQQPVF